MPKKIDDILHPTPPERPDAKLRQHILDRLRAAHGEGDALHTGDLVSDIKPPPIGEGGILIMLASGVAFHSTLKDLVDEGQVETAESDGLDYYWLSDEALPPASP